jgi:hypothetical protein
MLYNQLVERIRQLVKKYVNSTPDGNAKDCAETVKEQIRREYFLNDEEADWAEDMAYQMAKYHY